MTISNIEKNVKEEMEQLRARATEMGKDGGKKAGTVISRFFRSSSAKVSQSRALARFQWVWMRARVCSDIDSLPSAAVCGVMPKRIKNSCGAESGKRTSRPRGAATQFWLN